MPRLGPMPPAVRTAVERLIAERGEVTSVGSQSFRALTLHGGPTGFTCLDAEGTFWNHSFWFNESNEDLEELVQEKYETYRIAAIVIASERFPELAAWLPQKPDDAVDCLNCLGSGKWAIHPNMLCPGCAGLTWFDPVRISQSTRHERRRVSVAHVEADHAPEATAPSTFEKIARLVGARTGPKPFGLQSGSWEALKARMQPGDEIWEFQPWDGDPTAPAGGNSAGYELVRRDRVVARLTYRFSSATRPHD